MEILGKTFLDAIAASEFEQPTKAIAAAKITDNAVLKSWLASVLLPASKNQLVQSTLTTDHDPEVTWRLETTPINLPFAYANELGKVLDHETQLPVNIYMICESPLVTASSLRIDELGSVTDVLNDSEGALKILSSWVAEQQAQIEKNMATE